MWILIERELDISNIGMLSGRFHFARIGNVYEQCFIVTFSILIGFILKINKSNDQVICYKMFY